MTDLAQHVSSLPVLRLDGMHLDTLGHYFAALGLLRLSARQWPSVKGCWRDGVFCLVGGPVDLSELEAFLLDIGSNNKWTQYTQGWSDEQKKDTKEKTATNVSVWRGAHASETDSVYVLSHLALATRLSFNPVFGTGGNAGKRNFAKGWQKACNAVKAAAPKARKTRKNVRMDKVPVAMPSQMSTAAKHDLSAFLKGEACWFLADYLAACWFSDSNKKYNFSPKKPFCEGQITPWAMLLACEAFPLLVGATSRQLGSARKGTGAFPFVTQGSAPENEKEVETLTGEFWAPVWSNPLSVAEVSALYKRGRAEVNGRGAITSAAFAAAIIQRGTDAGLAEFRRFTLLHTTSPQTFESRLASVHMLEGKSVCSVSEASQADAASNILRFRDALPREFKKGKKWVFRGLQGPIDKALVRLAASADNENAWALLDAFFHSLEKTANNKNDREREPQFELLPVSWLMTLLGKERDLSPELRLALALASLRADGKKDKPFDKTTAPLIAYRVGVVPVWKNSWRKVKIAKNSPLRVEWSQRNLADNLCAVARRRVTVEAQADSELPFNARINLSLADVFAFLNRETDDTLLARWLDRFLLFDWSFVTQKQRETLSGILQGASPRKPISAQETLWAFLRPLFHAYTFGQVSAEGKTPTSGNLRPIVALLERGDTAAAYQAALNRYKSLSLSTADFGANAFNLSHSESRRLLAALILPMSPTSATQAFSRWTLPSASENTNKGNKQ